MEILEVREITKKYGKVIALDNISMKFELGITALLGHNGAGKSTLLNILSTTLSYDKGEIFYWGKPINKNEASYRNILGYMPQQQMLIPSLSVETFLVYMATMKNIKRNLLKSRVRTVLMQTDCYDIREKSLDSLSGGMKQRVLIAQALLNEPEVLLLDEPTAGLDPIQRLQFRALIADIAKDKVVILATHVIADVELIADKIVILKGGQIMTTKTQEELINGTTVYESYDSIEELNKIDPTIKFASTMPTKHGLKSRFISKALHKHQVQTTLDDVYIDWLG